LKAAQPVMEEAAQVARKMPPISRPSEREKTAVRQPPTAAHRGESGCACGPTSWSRSDSVPIWSASFDSGEPRCTSHTVAKT
jgi:hypothetical protein